jgi:hypothetical protein
MKLEHFRLDEVPDDANCYAFQQLEKRSCNPRHANWSFDIFSVLWRFVSKRPLAVQPDAIFSAAAKFSKELSEILDSGSINRG